MVGERVELVVRQSLADEMTPYERLLGDAIRGDPMLFVREDGVEAAWSVVDPILGNATPVHRVRTKLPGARLRLTISLPVMAAGTIPSRSQKKQWKRQNEGRERSEMMIEKKD